MVFLLQPVIASVSEAISGLIKPVIASVSEAISGLVKPVIASVSEAISGLMTVFILRDRHVAFAPRDDSIHTDSFGQAALRNPIKLYLVGHQF